MSPRGGDPYGDSRVCQLISLSSHLQGVDSPRFCTSSSHLGRRPSVSQKMSLKRKEPACFACLSRRHVSLEVWRPHGSLTHMAMWDLPAPESLKEGRLSVLSRKSVGRRPRWCRGDDWKYTRGIVRRNVLLSVWWLKVFGNTVTVLPKRNKTLK